MSRFCIASFLLVVSVIMGCGKESPKIDIELTTTTPVVDAMNRMPPFSVSFINRDKRAVTLVRPGDGSVDRLRTPVISWSAIDVDDPSKDPRQPQIGRGGCGNMNPLRQDEIFTLAAGEKITFDSWGHDRISPSFWLPPGTYEVSFNYSNVPDLKWADSKMRYDRNIWLQFAHHVHKLQRDPHHDRVAMKRVRKSTPFKRTSNPVKIVVKKLWEQSSVQ